MHRFSPIKRLQQHQRRWQHSTKEATFFIKEIGERLFERLELIKLTPMVVLETSHLFNNQTKKLAERYPQGKVLRNQLDSLAFSVPKRFWHQWKKQDQIMVADPHYLPLPDESVDFIFSNCLLYSSWDMPQLIAEWHRILKPNGLLLFSTLGPDTLKEWRKTESSLEQTSAIPSAVIDMHDLGDRLLHQGFADPVIDMEFLTLYYKNLKQLQHDVRVNMMNVVSPNTHFHGKKYWRAFEASYPIDLTFNQLPVTCEAIYGHAWKVKPPVSTDYIIPLSQIKRVR